MKSRIKPDLVRDLCTQTDLMDSFSIEYFFTRQGDRETSPVVVVEFRLKF